MAGFKSWREKKGEGGRNLKILDNREEVSFFLIVQLRGNENSNTKLTKKYDLCYFISQNRILNLT